MNCSEQCFRKMGGTDHCELVELLCDRYRCDERVLQIVKIRTKLARYINKGLLDKKVQNIWHDINNDRVYI